MICPDEHTHGDNTTCYHTHGCRCDDCRASSTRREANRMRQIAYGRYRGRVPAQGVARRIHGLHYLGWTSKHIAELCGLDTRYLSRIAHCKWVSPETFDTVANAYGVLMRRGVGPSARSAGHARRQGWVSPFAWNDIDADAEPVGVGRAKRREGVLRGDELFNEIVWLAETGTHPNDIATAVGKRLDTLETYLRRHDRDDLLVHLRERKAA